ncbi:calcium release-activated calcium channel protein 1-like isoform X2 [Vespa crabro]|uniref:calcium release-activated calcium channel protein 1-like isoform X2 n=1 Tax=Vespa crabro TaxID=7445 RepID=UPI001F0042A3|nr:calcium release-activated calcium channel protein 1-like isoform X2 [Vespa crabro]
MCENSKLKENNVMSQDNSESIESIKSKSASLDHFEDEKRGKSCADEFIVGKSNKSTQSDITHSNWRHSYGLSHKSYYGGLQQQRSTSTLHLPKHTRNRASKYVTLDMRSNVVGTPPSHLYLPSNSNNYTLGGSVQPCNTCCCACNGPQNSQTNVPLVTSPSINEHDGPQSLSWRRLHMSRAKLKATATTSELLSGFAMVAMVELQINDPTAVPEWLFVMFAVCTTVLVSVHIFALMISTYLLPNVEAISKLQISRLITESPHERMRGFIELAWAFSTVLGLFLFLVEVAILCWVKFWDYSFTAATASTIIVIPVLIVFVAFAVHFYHSLVVYKCETSISDIKELESIKRNLDNATINHTTV